MRGWINTFLNMSYSKREREDYNRHREHVTRELGLEKKHYNALRRVSHALTDADTNYANGTQGSRHHYAEPIYKGNKILNEYTEKHHSKDVSGAFKKAEALRKKIGGKHKIHFYHQSDPRGAALYVAKHRMKDTDYHNKGHVIY